MKQWKVGIIGATGMVGQRFATLLDGHPWFQVVALAASPRSAGKTYEAAVGSRWAMTTPMPETMKDMVMLDAQADIEKIAGMVDFVFCAVDMKKDEIRALEEAYAKAECPVVSNNYAHRFTPDVPMVIPEVNPEHLDIIASQRKRLGTKKGFIAVKSNCSIQSYVPALSPLRKYGIKQVLACTYQAISGAGKTFQTWPEMVDNVIPFIGGEEENDLTSVKAGGDVHQLHLQTVSGDLFLADVKGVAFLFAVILHRAAVGVRCQPQHRAQGLHNSLVRNVMISLCAGAELRPLRRFHNDLIPHFHLHTLGVKVIILAAATKADADHFSQRSSSNSTARAPSTWLTPTL